MNPYSTTRPYATAPGSQIALADAGASSMRDKVDALRFAIAVVTTQLLFRAALLLRRWNY